MCGRSLRTSRSTLGQLLLNAAGALATDCSRADSEVGRPPATCCSLLLLSSNLEYVFRRSWEEPHTGPSSENIGPLSGNIFTHLGNYVLHYEVSSHMLWCIGTDVSEEPAASIFSVPAKSWYKSTRLHGVISKKTLISTVFTSVRA
jgi:hypothetical protein